MNLLDKIIKVYHYILFIIKLKIYKVKYGDRIRGNRVVLKNEGTIILGNKVSLNSYPSGELYTTGIHTYGKKSLVKIGNNCNLNGTTIYSRKKVIIGDYCMFGPGVKIIDNNSHRISIDIEERRKSPESKEIIIENNVWIGSNSLILKGITIGENSIVAAHSVITKDIPKNVLVAGNPAVIIKNLEN